MAIALPVEIAAVITGYVDKRSLLNLLLVSHTFLYLAEPRLYTNVSFLVDIRASLNWDLENLFAKARSFLHSITTGDRSRARHVKRIYLPTAAFGEYLRSVLQSILKSVPNLEELRICLSIKDNSINFRTLFEDSQGESSPPPFALKSLAWIGWMGLDQAGFEWFLASQKSLELLLIPAISSFPLRVPAHSRVRVIEIPSLHAASALLETGQITHLHADLAGLERLNNDALRNVVVCVTRRSTLETLAKAAVRMPNLECLETDIMKTSIPDMLSRIDTFKGTKLRHLRFYPINQACEQWDHGDIVNAFDRLPSLDHISFQLRSPMTKFPEYCCFTRGMPQPVKLCSLQPAVMHHTEWWHDWVKDCAIVPFKPSDHQAGYKGVLLPS